MVRRDKNIPWEVIIRKFKCEISEKEQAELDVWLADVENHARFQSWQSLWLSIMEENMRRALQISGGDWMVFLEKPISATLLGIAVVSLVLPPLWRRLRRTRH